MKIHPDGTLEGTPEELKAYKEEKVINKLPDWKQPYYRPPSITPSDTTPWDILLPKTYCGSGATTCPDWIKDTVVMNQGGMN